MLRRLADGAHASTTFVAEADGRHAKALLAPPFMHGAGHWVALRVWLGGGTVFLPSNPEHLDPADVWGLVERERIDFLLIVGDAFARPLLDELDRHALRPVEPQRRAVRRRRAVGRARSRSCSATCRR